MSGSRLRKALVALTALGIAFGATADTAMQSGRLGGIEVRVTPGRLAPDAATWDFAMVFETHTAALAGDPARFTVLLDPQGRAHAALRWDGDPPGGHHRKGTLRFKPLVPAPASVTLKLRGVGGVAEHGFTWTLAGR